jgi:hypothetical protein
LGNTKVKKHLEKLGVDGRVIFKMDLKQQDGCTWTGVIWLRIERSGGVL